MNDIILWYILALQRLFHFTAYVLSLSISLSFLFFVESTTCVIIEVSLSMLLIKQWSFSQVPNWSFEGWFGSGWKNLIYDLSPVAL